MSWLSGLSDTGSRQRPGFALVGHGAQGEAQQLELFAGGGEQEIALVAGRVGGAVQLGAVRALDAPHVMAGGQGVGAEVAGGGQQVMEFDALVAADAGDRGFAAQIGSGEVVDHRGPEAALVVEHVVGDTEVVGHPPRIMDVLAGAAGALAAHRLAMVVELQGDADYIETLFRQQRRGDRGIDPARHGDHHPGLAGRLGYAQRICAR